MLKHVMQSMIFFSRNKFQIKVPTMFDHKRELIVLYSHRFEYRTLKSSNSIIRKEIDMNRVVVRMKARKVE